VAGRGSPALAGGVLIGALICGSWWGDRNVLTPSRQGAKQNPGRLFFAPLRLRVADVQVRVPDASGGWRATRPTVTGAVDARSTKLVVDVRESENWTGILAGLAAWHAANGLPRRVTMDRGEAYKKTARAHGRRSRGRTAIDAPAVESVFARFGIEVHAAIPYHPWAKKIESIWRWLKWGWDPKEVFALNTWLVYAILIHVRLLVRNKGYWTAWLSLAGCGMMAFNWWVVNFYIVGLHSYA
jgi:ABC-type transport system involved in cytochrome c biogenesis permease subunit